MPSQLFNERFLQTFRPRINAQIAGPVRLLPHMFRSLVITTNYDNVIENLFGENWFQHIVFGQSITNFRRFRSGGSHCLLKLHGQYNQPETRILTKLEYDAFYGDGCVGREEVALIFKNNSLLFLGCSLKDDRTMALMHDVASLDPNMPNHYAFLKEEDPILEREHFLAARNIFPIWYQKDEAHDDAIEALLLGLILKQHQQTI